MNTIIIRGVNPDEIIAVDALPEGIRIEVISFPHSRIILSLDKIAELAQALVRSASEVTRLQKPSDV